MKRAHLQRRTFLKGLGATLGGLSVGSLFGARTHAAPHFEPIARRVVYLFMAGAPSQLETFDHKPRLRDLDGTELPASVRQGQRLTGMTSGQDSFPVVAPRFEFSQHGDSGAWVSELLPHTAEIVDKLAIIKTMQSDAINHEPGMTLMQTGDERAGRPCMGSWLSYGLGAEGQDLPSFVVLTSRSATLRRPQPVSSRLWGPGFLPPSYQGTLLRGGPEPVLYLDEPKPAPDSQRERILQARNRLDGLLSDATSDPEVAARIEAYELAFRMQTSVPEVTRFHDEPETTYDLYGDDARTPGTYAANCLFARRLLERGVPFVQLYHRDWDHHETMQSDHPIVARDTDQPTAALIRDLESRGLLEDTLVIWGGEFGRTVYAQGEVESDEYGRDHHGRCFSMWMAGGGIRGGTVLGETDDFSYNVIEDPVEPADFHATVLHLLGFDHTRLTYRHQGRDFRLTDVSGRVLNSILQ